MSACLWVLSIHIKYSKWNYKFVCCTCPNNAILVFGWRSQRADGGMCRDKVLHRAVKDWCSYQIPILSILLSTHSPSCLFPHVTSLHLVLPAPQTSLPHAAPHHLSYNVSSVSLPVSLPDLCVQNFPLLITCTPYFSRFLPRPLPASFLAPFLISLTINNATCWASALIAVT